MKNGKFADAKIKSICIVLAFILLFSSAQIVVSEFSDYASVALAKTVERSTQQQAVSFNDLTEEGLNSLYLPNYDTEKITISGLPKPDVTTFGKHTVDYYPSYTNQITDFDNSKKTEILAENQAMIANTQKWFEEGTLRQNLQKHVSADGQFYNAKGSYDDAPRIEKEITINTNIAARKRSLGIFAPAGEVLTVTIDESLVGKLTVTIGYPYNAECEIGSGAFGRWKNDRMAQFFLSFKLTSTKTEIGSPLGGMVTLEGVGDSLQNFKITVSGGVDMPDYKLGVSTKEDWQKILAAPGPYVWLLTPYQYFVMPKVEISDIEDPYNALLWWHKASMISMYSMAREDTSHFYTPVISVFDSYVYIGEGVAKVWAFVTNAPTYWCHGILDYDNLMYNGAWGAIHEYNHHHQSHAYASVEWGVGGHDEVTNNVINALSYILLTDIATTRSETNVLNGWGAVSDPYCNYKRFATASNSSANYEAFDTNKLFGYVDLMHTFGADKFIDFLRAQYGYGDVEGYEGSNLTQDNYLTTQDGFTLFASLFYKTDFVDYFTKVWHFNLSSGVVKKIKSYGFDEYFSISNLYSAGVKGIETGRAYKVNVGTTNVLNFDEYTLCSTNDYVLERVTEPQHGTLTDNGDGTYSYTPNSNFTQDSIDLVYKVTLNGKIYYRTLVVKLSANYNFIETVTYGSDESKRGLSVEQAISELVNEDNVLSKGFASSFTTTTSNGDNLTGFKASVVFPFTKSVTFMVYGDDKAWLKVGDKTAYTTTYIGNDNDAINKQTTNKIENVSVSEGEPLKVEAYCFNTGGSGNLRVKYSIDDGKTYQDIPSSYCYAYNASKEDIQKANQATTNVYPAYVDFRNLYLTKWYASAISFTPSEAQCLDNDGVAVKTVNGADIKTLFDGDTSTGFHTAWQGAKTPYPHNYYFTFDQEPFFNTMKFTFQPGYYAIGEYEIWASEDGDNYELLCSGNNTGSNFSVPFDKTVTARHIKLVVKSNSQGQPFTNIREIEFLQSKDMQTEYNVYSSSDSLLNYESGNWKDVQGDYINSTAKHVDNGTVKFYLTGTDFILYSTNKASTVKIDGVDYSIRENANAYTPSFIADGLTFAKHVIEIQAKDMTIDMIKTTGQISEVVDFGSMQLDIANQFYNGKELSPVLRCNGVSLIEGVDYTVVSIENNVNIGTARFKIEALGVNRGVYESTFEILPVHLDNMNVTIAPIGNVGYTGSEITPQLVVSIALGGEQVTLREGQDFDVTYFNNIEIGVANIVLSFKGNLYGIATAQFNIVQATVNWTGMGISIGMAVLFIATFTMWAVLEIKKKKKKY